MDGELAMFLTHEGAILEVPMRTVPAPHQVIFEAATIKRGLEIEAYRKGVSVFVFTRKSPRAPFVFFGFQRFIGASSPVAVYLETESEEA